jgi:HK97 family phage major capsid protein
MVEVDLRKEIAVMMGGTPWFVWGSADIESLRDKLCELADEMEAIALAAESESRSMTDEERKQFDDIWAKFRNLEAKLKVIEQQGDTIPPVRRGTGRLTTPEGPEGGYDYSLDQYRGRGDRGAVGKGALDATARLRMQRQPFEGRRFVELFGHAEKSDFRSAEEFFTIIANNQFDPRLMRAAAMEEGTGSAGGFLVPVQFARDILDRALEQSVMWGRVRVEPMTTNQLSISSFENNDNSAGKPYGLLPEWRGEGQAYTEQQAQVRAILLKSNKCGILVPFSVELGEDAPNFAASLQTAVSEAIAWGIDDAILTGNGVARPLGILNGPSTVTVAKETGQAADTINFNNIVKMFSRLHPQSVPSAVWLANPNTLPQLLTMTIAIKNVAGTENVGGSWYPALTQESGVYSLLGRPLLLTEKCASLGDLGDIMLVDPRQYVVGLRRDLTVALDPYSKFASDQIQLKVTIRLAGQPVQAAAFTPKNGTATLAPFVVLAERA